MPASGSRCATVMSLQPRQTRPRFARTPRCARTTSSFQWASRAPRTSSSRQSLAPLVDLELQYLTEFGGGVGAVRPYLWLQVTGPQGRSIPIRGLIRYRGRPLVVAG